MLEDEQFVFQYLEEVVEYGFDQVEKIYNYDVLVFLCFCLVFQVFVDNGY